VSSLMSWLQRRSIGQIRNIGGGLIREPVKRGRAVDNSEDTTSSIGQANAKRRFERSLEKQARATLRQRMKADADPDNDHAPIAKADLKREMDLIRKEATSRAAAGQGAALSQADLARVAQLVLMELDKRKGKDDADADKQRAIDDFIKRQDEADNADADVQAHAGGAQPEEKKPLFDMDELVTEVRALLDIVPVPKPEADGDFMITESGKWVLYTPGGST